MTIEQKDKKDTLCWLVLICATTIAFAFFLYTNRHGILGCYDSIVDYMFARINGFGAIFSRHLTYNIKRGRLTILFSFLTSVKDFLYRADNDFIDWAVQYVPILTNVFLIAYIIGRKTKREYGALFPIFFIVFLQVDIWHSLIVCYPFDFMYGLTAMIISVWLFSEYLHNPERCGKKCLFLSVFAFYEALVVYESFLLCSLIFAFLAIDKLLRPKFSIKRYLRALLPYIMVGVIYLVSYIICRKAFPSDTITLDEGGFLGIEECVKTYVGFTTNMFPLAGFLRGHISEGIKTYALMNPAVDIVALTTTLGAIAAVRLIMRKSSPETIKPLINIGISGLILALTFALPHALTGHYQDWYINGKSLGYVPSTICYFGWAVFIVSGILILLTLVSRYKYSRLIASILTFFIVGCGFIMVFDSNAYYMAINSDIFSQAENLDEFFESDQAQNTEPDLLYVPSLQGVFGEMKYNEAYFNTVTGLETHVVNNAEDFTSAIAEGRYSNIYYYYYDRDAGAYIYGRLDENGNMVNLLLDTSEEGDFIVSFVNSAGDRRTYEEYDVSDSSIIGETAIVDTIDIERII